MARTARVKLSATGVADYHLMSRTNDKRFLFEKGEVKTQLADALKRAAAFCGVRIRAYAVMGNHFHVVVRVTRADAPIPEDELLRRVAALKGDGAADELAGHWKDLHAAGMEGQFEEEADRLRRRMTDISAFIKEFKELFNRWYRRDHDYTGSIWDGRFKSTLIEDGRYLATCIKYVLYNPVRAGIVTQAKDYAWNWSETDSEIKDKLGSVPEEWCMMRRGQIGAGRVYGSVEFVMGMVFALGNCFHAKKVAAHGIAGLPAEAGSSVLGWKIAADVA